MMFPVIVHSSPGLFEAALVGAPEVRATAQTREAALAALQAVIAKRLDQGELVALEVHRRQLLHKAGPQCQAPDLPRWEGDVIGTLSREEIYDDAV